MKVLLRSCLYAALAVFSAAPAWAATTVELWHAMSGALGERVNELVDKFNKSQTDYVVRAVGKGSYDEVVNSMIAAYRAKQQPAIVQVNERGFLTMVNSNAIIPTAELMTKAGYKIDWSNFIAPVATYFTRDGAMMAMPFNSSTPILFYNVDHFKAAGFDKPAATWPELEEQLYAINRKGVSKCAMVFPADWEWSFLENYSAIEDHPYATKRNGFDGLGAEYVFNKTPLVEPHGAREELPRRRHPDARRAGHQSRAALHRGPVLNGDQLHGGPRGRGGGLEVQLERRSLPSEKAGAAKNSVIGGAALWTLKGHKDEDYKAVAAFYNFLANVDTQVWWHQATGYVPVTRAAYDAAKAQGYYKKSPTREIAVEQLVRGTPSDNSRGFRLGNSAQANIAIKEEIQAGLLGQKPIQKAMDDAVARGNEVLRQFERVNAGRN